MEVQGHSLAAPQLESKGWPYKVYIVLGSSEFVIRIMSYVSFQVIGQSGEKGKTSVLCHAYRELESKVSFGTNVPKSMSRKNLHPIFRPSPESFTLNECFTFLK